MQAQAGTPQELISLIQALIVLFVAAPAFVQDDIAPEQRAVLEDIADLAPEPGQILPAQGLHIETVDDHRASIGTDQADDVLEQDTLAGA